jgi:hypothetical protein
MHGPLQSRAARLRPYTDDRHYDPRSCWDDHSSTWTMETEPKPSTANMALPSMFLTSNLDLENAWAVMALVHGVVSGETAHALIASANDRRYEFPAEASRRAHSAHPLKSSARDHHSARHRAAVEEGSEMCETGRRLPLLGKVVSCEICEAGCQLRLPGEVVSGAGTPQPRCRRRRPAVAPVGR